MTSSAKASARSNGREAPNPPRTVIDVRDASVRYDDQLALRDVDLTVTSGEVVALLGPNGSGKSTLIRAILGLVPLAAGTLELFGQPASRLRERGRIGYVPQRHTVGGGIPATVEEVVAAGRLGRRRFRPGLNRADREIVVDAIDMVGLTGKLRENVAHLSGGQQRRSLIARALASEPEVLVMDEPFAGVDANNQEILVRTLDQLIDRGLTLVLVTHELGPVSSLVRRTVHLRHGRIVSDQEQTSQAAPVSTHADAVTGPAVAETVAARGADTPVSAHGPGTGAGNTGTGSAGTGDAGMGGAAEQTHLSSAPDCDPHPVDHAEDTLGTGLGLDGGTVS